MKWKAKVQQGIMNYTGLQEYPEGVLSGRYGDYFVNMTWDGTTGIYTVVIDAVPTVPPGLPAQAFLGQMAAQKLADRGYSCTGAHLSARIQGKNSADKTVAKLMTYLDTAVRYLAENGFISGCGSCGRQDAALNLCSVNGEMDFLCPDCFSRVNQSLELNRQAKKAVKGNPVAGIVGAFLGALIGAALWVLIYHLGYIAGLAGLVMAVLALKGYEKFAGNLNVIGIIVCLAMVAVMIYFANNVAFALEIYGAYKTEFDIGFSDAYRAIPEFLKDSEISAVYYKDLIIGYILTAVASAGTIYGMFRASTGAYKTKKF